MTREEVDELFRLIRRESRGQYSGGPSAMAWKKDLTNELALKLTILETELRGLRQVLAEVKANLNEPQQEMDEFSRNRRLAERKEPTPIGVKRPAWFCGRAVATN
jgi:hypothetical protein